LRSGEARIDDGAGSAELSSNHHYKALDGVRGVAIILVFFFHFARWNDTSTLIARLFNAATASGWIGVDIFFVLSGFLITGILYDTRNDDHYSRRFYVRRMLRIFPIFYGSCLVLLILAPVLHIGWRWGYLAILFYGANFLQARSPSYDQVGPVLIGHVWSLAVEEQFYLLWPSAVRILKTRTRILSLAVALAVSAFILRIVELRVGVDLRAIYRDLFTRMDTLAIGAALALLLRGPRKQFWETAARRSLLPLWGLLLVIAVLERRFDHYDPVTITWGYSLLALASAALIAEAIRPESWTAKIMSNRVLRFLGKISYGLYLYQGLVIVAARPVLALLRRCIPSRLAADSCTFAIALMGTVLFSYLSYQFYERPFLRLKSRLAP
jgi:peptidoglycan/LPS O-acetylase OafA/YrhL